MEGKIINDNTINCGIGELGGINLELIENAEDPRYGLWKRFIEKYHYIGHGKLYGRQIRYLVRSEKYGWLGALSYSSPAWKLKGRDKWIGWNDVDRLKKLDRIVCNSRFLILPYVRVKNLASHILSLSLRRLKADWYNKYGIIPVLVETFVERGRFEGTSYRAANFQRAGVTCGRGRQDRYNRYELPVKSIYLYPLSANCTRELGGGDEPVIMKESVPADWVEEEFNEADLKDERLKKRLYTITRDFYGNPVANIPQACQSRAKSKAVYRFFDNKEVAMDKLLASHYEATIKRMVKEKTVLAVQDTTSLDYSTHPMTDDIGPIASINDKTIGLMVHDTMAFNEEGTPLGLLNVQCWARDKEEFGTKEKRKELPIWEKESRKWIISYNAASEARKKCSGTRIISVGDRESDIYELFRTAVEKRDGAELLIRAQYNRLTSDEEGHVWDKLERITISGIQRIKIPRKGNRQAREADLSIRYSEVEIKAPKNGKEKGSVKLWAMLAREENLLESIEPLNWMLFTTLPIRSFEEAVEKLEWYTKRWGIEIYHRTMKSGCKIENRQLGNADRIESCLAIDMVIAWRIYHLTKLGREVPDVPCTVFFEEAEWKALVSYKTGNPVAPPKPPTLKEAVRMVASIGGFLGRKGDGDPGTKTIWLGIQALDIITDTWKVFNKNIAARPFPPP